MGAQINWPSIYQIDCWCEGAQNVSAIRSTSLASALTRTLAADRGSIESGVECLAKALAWGAEKSKEATLPKKPRQATIKIATNNPSSLLLLDPYSLFFHSFFDGSRTDGYLCATREPAAGQGDSKRRTPPLHLCALPRKMPPPIHSAPPDALHLRAHIDIHIHTHTHPISPKSCPAYASILPARLSTLRIVSCAILRGMSSITIVYSISRC